nr:MvChR2 [synthetic construct]
MADVVPPATPVSDICFAPCQEDCITIRYFIENDFEGCLPGHFDQYSSFGVLPDVSKAALYICMVVSVIQIAFYGFQWWRKTCGWEVWFVAVIETAIYIINITSEADSPFTLYLTNGRLSPQVRYMEWLMTCPVILIALSNITGMAEEYNKRTMTLLTSDVCCIVLGMMAAVSKPKLKGILYAVGWMFGLLQFWTAFMVYHDAHKAVPKPLAWYVRAMGYVFFASWSTFPAFFLLGPEGLEVFSGTVSTIAHACSDMVSKNLWGFMDWHLRVLVARYHRRLFKAEEEHAAKKGQTLDAGLPRSTSFVRGLGDDVEIDP